MRRVTLLLALSVSVVFIFFAGFLVGNQGGAPGLEVRVDGAVPAGPAAGGLAAPAGTPASAVEKSGCSRAYQSPSSRPGSPCLPPAAFYPFRELTGWRWRLGERVVTAASPTLTEDACGGFALFGHSTWCLQAMVSNLEVLGLSYGAGSRDPWSEKMSNTFGVPSRLFDCFEEAAAEKSPLADGHALNGAASCKGRKGICYERPYTFARTCLGARDAPRYETLSSHLRGRAPLSVHVRMDVEGAEWGVIEQLLSSEDDIAKIRTLDLSLHFASIHSSERSTTLARSAEQLRLEHRVQVLERLAQRFNVAGSTLEYHREHWKPEVYCPGSSCPEPAVHTPSMAVNELTVSMVNPALVAGRPPASLSGAAQGGGGGGEPPFVSRVERPCERVIGDKSSRPGVPCLPPAQVYPFKTKTLWRLELGERVALAVTPDITEAQCGGFSYFGDSTWCNIAMQKPDALALSFGIEQRDLWSEKMSNVYHMRTKLYDCFIPPHLSPPMAGTAPNATGPCEKDGPHCYEQPYEAYRICLAPEKREHNGREYETLQMHLAGRGPLSTHVKVDVEGYEWPVFEQLLASEEDMAKIRTLEFEVHFGYVLQFGERQVKEREMLENRVAVMERLLGRFACTGSTLEVYREDWSPEKDCAESTCGEPNLHIPSMSVNQFAVSYVNRALLLSADGTPRSDPVPPGDGRLGDDQGEPAVEVEDDAQKEEPKKDERQDAEQEASAKSAERSCSATRHEKSSRPGEPCLPPAAFYPFRDRTEWRIALGERIVAAVTPEAEVTEEVCQGFQLFGDSTWCLRAMSKDGVADPLGLSYGIEQRDLWSEKMSNIFKVPTRLYDCFIPPGDSPPIAGTAPNASGPCDPNGAHCYETPYQSFRECLGPTSGVIEGRTVATLESHLRGRAPLSTWLKIDVEGNEWSVLEWLLSSEEDMAKVRTLEMEVHFSYVPFGERQDVIGMSEQDRLERRTQVMERLLTGFACTGSNLEVYREEWNPEAECQGSSCEEPKVHIPSFSVDQFAVSYVNRALLRATDAGASGSGSSVSAEAPCRAVLTDLSSRPGRPCMYPAAAYPYKTRTPWRIALGERIVAAVTPDLKEETCEGFQLFGDSTWCLSVMRKDGVPDPIGFSYGIEQRDMWSEKMSNIFKIPTRLYDCFIPAKDSPPIAGTAPNATGPCDPDGPHCYETPYQPFQECLGPQAGVIEGRTVVTLESHLQGRGPLSTWLKIDVEGSEWSVLEWLLDSQEDIAKVRTLEMEVHFSFVAFGELESVRELSQQERLERRVRVMERLLEHFACTGSNLEVYREEWKPEERCPDSDCDEPAVHLPSMQVDQFAVSYVNRALLAVGSAPAVTAPAAGPAVQGATESLAGQQPQASTPLMETPPRSDRFADATPASHAQFSPAYPRPCEYMQGSPQSSRPGMPCLPPPPVWPFQTYTTWRTELGERIVASVIPIVSEEDCDGFYYWGDQTWCNAAMGGPDLLGLSYGIEERDLWSEVLSQKYHIPVWLHDCFIPLDRSPPMAGTAPNATVPCEAHVGHCYGAPYIPFRTCLGARQETIEGRNYDTLENDLRSRAPLSVHLKIDVEGSEWTVLQRLLDSKEDLMKIRSLDMEVHFGHGAPSEADARAGHTEQERLDREIRVMERLQEVFVVTGSTLEVYRQGWRPDDNCPTQQCYEPIVHTRGGFNVQQFAVSYVNGALLRG